MKVKRWKKIYHVNSNCKKAGVALLTSDKIDFKTKDAGDKEGHFITIRELIPQEDISINIYTFSLLQMGTLLLIITMAIADIYNWLGRVSGKDLCNS